MCYKVQLVIFNCFVSSWVSSGYNDKNANFKCRKYSIIMQFLKVIILNNNHTYKRKTVWSPYPYPCPPYPPWQGKAGAWSLPPRFFYFFSVIFFCVFLFFLMFYLPIFNLYIFYFGILFVMGFCFRNLIVKICEK